MSGALTEMLGGPTSGSPAGGPASFNWTNIYGQSGSRFAANNAITFAGLTGPLTLTMTVTGPVCGAAGAIKNGVVPFQWPSASATVQNGDTLAWAINNGCFGGDVSGTATITRADTGAVVATFTYFVQY